LPEAVPGGGAGAREPRVVIDKDDSTPRVPLGMRESLPRQFGVGAGSQARETVKPSKSARFGGLRAAVENDSKSWERD
jgi:hypothetical protein